MLIKENHKEGQARRGYGKVEMTGTDVLEAKMETKEKNLSLLEQRLHY